MNIEQIGREVATLEVLARALALATDSRLMSLEHGGAVWKKYLKDRGFDVLRPALIKEPVKEKTK